MTAPRLEVVVWRDPDEGTDVAVFVDGQRVQEAEVTVIDPGRGHTRTDWDTTAAMEIQLASPAAAELLMDWYAKAGQSRHITGEGP